MQLHIDQALWLEKQVGFVGEDYVIVSSYFCEDTECLPHKGPPQLNELSSTSINVYPPKKITEFLSMRSSQIPDCADLDHPNV